jgi:hypothetical protein
VEKFGGFEDLGLLVKEMKDGEGRRDTVTLCPACFNAVAAVSPAIPAPTMRMLSCSELVLEPMLSRYVGSACFKRR